MKKSQQSTLFQTWGYFGKQKKHDHEKNKRDASQKGTNSLCNNKDDVNINLVGFSDDDDDDLDLLQCVDTSTNHGIQKPEQKRSIQDTNNFKLLDNYGEKEIYLDNNHCRQPSHETISGFDAKFGSTYIYPTNYPIRDYQFNIIRKSILKNTLVVLPTGLGKTFIAAVVMYNFYRWYPQKKLIFMAPTKPLVAQQIEACHNVMGIPQTDTSEMTGALSPNKRQVLWGSKRVFFMTPQVLQNDLGRGICIAGDFVCLVFDEAHKALGNHAYSQVIKEISRHHSKFRVLALSATPGSDMKAVQEVVSNLLISHVELRSEDSIDIQKYVHDRKIERIVIPFCDQIKEARKTFLELLQTVIIRLHGKKAIWQNDASKASKFLILKAREQWRANNVGQDRAMVGSIEGDFALLMSLYHAMDLLVQHGLLSFYNFLKGVLVGHKGTSRSKMEMSRNPKFMDLMEDLHSKIEGEDGNQSLNETIVTEQAMTPKQRLLKSIPKPNRAFSSHPKIKKLEEVVVNHFRKFQAQNTAPASNQTPLNTRIMIFSQFRDSVQEITAVLSRHEPLVKVMSFIGQGSKEGSNKTNNKGLSQKEQLEVLRRFRAGGYNTVVSTSVGEEGLDIGDVDLIICFDASSSPIRLVQRIGRTGRKRNGRIVILVGEGKEEAMYKRSLNNKKGIHKHLMNASKSLELYDQSPRLIPKHLNPKCYKLNIVVERYESNQNKKQSKKNIATSSSSSSSSKKKANKSIKAFAEKGLLNNGEQEYLEETFQGNRVGCKNCEKLQQQQSTSRNTKKRYCYHVNTRSPLSLSAWGPWQTNTQSTSHSTRTSKFCDIMQSIERFKSPTEVQDYEKWISSKFKKSDVYDGVSSSVSPTTTTTTTTSTISKTKLKNKNTPKTPKRKVCGGGRLWRQSIGKNLPGALNLSDNSDVDDFSHKQNNKNRNNQQQQQSGFDVANNIVEKDESNKNVTREIEDDQIMSAQKGVKVSIDLSNDADEKFKPCSLEQMLEKVEERLSTQRRKKRVRLTRFPKPPVIDLDVSDISDQQIGFCSQVTMDTLYNRCQKKRKRDQFDILLEDHDDYDITEDGNHGHGDDDNDDVSRGFNEQPAIKRIKYNGDTIRDQEFTEIVKNEDKLSFLPDTQQAFSYMFPVSTPSEKISGNQAISPKSSSNYHQSKQHSVTIPDAVPEAPADIELSSFSLFDSTCLEKESNGVDNLLKIPSQSRSHCDKDHDDVTNTNSVLGHHGHLPRGGGACQESEGDINLSDSWLNCFYNDDLDIDDVDDTFQGDSSPPVVSQYHIVHNKFAGGGNNDKVKSFKNVNITANVGDHCMQPNKDSVEATDVLVDENEAFQRIKLSKKKDNLVDTANLRRSESIDVKECDSHNEILVEDEPENISETDGEEDSPVLVKRPAARSKNRIIESQISPQSEVKPIATTGCENDRKIKSKLAGQSRRLSMLERRKQAKMFLDDQCQDESMANGHKDVDESLFDNNHYVIDSFIDDATQTTPWSAQYKKNKKGRSPVDMNFIYKQSLLSPRNNALNFHTPAFKTNGSRYKLVNLAQKYNNISCDEDSEAEEVAGLVDSQDEARRFSRKSLQEEWKKCKINASDTKSNNRLLSGKPGRSRIKMAVSSDDDESTENDDFCVGKNKKSGGGVVNEKKNRQQQRWCRTYTADEIPEITFSFQIDWENH